MAPNHTFRQFPLMVDNGIVSFFALAPEGERDQIRESIWGKLAHTALQTESAGRIESNHLNNIPGRHGGVAGGEFAHFFE